MIETQQMADFMGVRTDTGELVNVMVVVAPALSLTHDIAVADPSGKPCRWIVYCNSIRLWMQQTCRASGGIGGPGIQVEYLMTQAPSGVIGVVGKVVLVRIWIPYIYRGLRCRISVVPEPIPSGSTT